MDKEKIIKKLDELLKLDDDWNSYGALAMSKFPKLRMRCLNFIDKIPDNMPDPYLCPGDGAIQFEWDSTDNSLECEIQESASVSVLLIIDGRESELELDMDDMFYRNYALTKVCGWFLREKGWFAKERENAKNKKRKSTS